MYFFHYAILAIQKFVIEEYYLNADRCALFKNLKEFYILASPMKEEYNVVMFLAFLEDCPVLQKIQIDVSFCSYFYVVVFFKLTIFTTIFLCITVSKVLLEWDTQEIVHIWGCKISKHVFK